MWRKEKTDSSIVGLPLLLAMVTTPMAATFLVSNLTLAKASANTLPSPLVETVSSGTQQKIDGLSRTSAINSPVAEILAQAAASDETSSGNQAFTPWADKKLNGELLHTLRWWLLAPVSVMGGLLLWKFQRNRSLRKERHEKIAEKTTTTKDAASAGALTSEFDSTAHLTKLQPQQTKIQYVYPPLPDVWDEVEADSQLVSSEAVSVDPTQTELEEVGLEEQQTVVVDTLNADVTEVPQVTTPEVTEVNASLPIVTVIPQTVSQTPVQTDEVEVSWTELPDEIVLDMEAPVAIVTHSYPEFSEIATVASTVQAARKQLEAPYSEQLDVSDDIQEDSETLTAIPDDIKNGIFLTPRTPKWAYTFWNISDIERESLRQQGGSQLAVRLYDVTDIDLSSQTPHLIQQYECEEVIHNHVIAIPASDRDYMVEIGYLTDDSRWLLLSRSATVRVLNHPDSNNWFVADAELVIHGAAKPGSTVTVDGRSVKLKQDGTFQLRIPFTENAIEHCMEATTNDGEHGKTIHMKFVKEEPTN
ncbi:MAG: DUF4912 domain-containing protein [Scytonema sp. PMC 1069.18]|nr:DUF4912 domain-containing protein [Scytonema sp. PMC 1069.18]MEC4882282.1 DUF4912 domain-containing protein [Scytonema sp. PMC 1070.18]